MVNWYEISFQILKLITVHDNRNAGIKLNTNTRITGYLSFVRFCMSIY